jgi:DNA polymerase I
MGKLPIERRIKKIWDDIEKGKKVDIGARWEQVCADLPQETAAVEANCGPVPEATLDDIPYAAAVTYACRDADATLRVFPILSEAIDAMGLRGCYDMDIAVIPMVEAMQNIGIAIDKPHFHRLEEKLTILMAEEVESICHLVPGLDFSFNPNSGDQVADLLFHQLGMTSTKLTKSKSRESTNDKVLEAMRRDSPVLPHILNYRELAKARDSFCVVMPRLAGPDGRVRCNLRVTRVSSGRLSATKPNLLAIPVRSDVGKDVRKGFVCAPGYILGSWDLDQAEMRYMADESNDVRLCTIFREGKVDVHTQTAAWMFGKSTSDVTKIERYAAKRIGFGVITGITETGLYDQMALAGATGWTVGKCADAIVGYFDVYEGVKIYMEHCRAEARRYGYVRDRWGRIRYLPGVHSRIDQIRAEAERQSHSHKIQAGAQGLMKRAQAEMWPWMQSMGDRLRPLLQIHDSLLCEVKADFDTMEEVDALIPHYMMNTTKLSVPMGAKGGYGETWGDIE